MKMVRISLLPFLKRFAVAIILLHLVIGQSPASGDGHAAASADLQPGVVVEKVAANSVAEKAALQPGDVLLRWTRGDATGEIESPFDLSLIEIEQSPRGMVKFEGLRENEKREWNFAPDDWRLKTRPNFQGKLLSLYREGQQLAEAGKPAEAAERWRTAAEKTNGSDPIWLRLWLLSHAADVLTEARQWKEVDAIYEDAIEQSVDAGPAIKTQLLRIWAATFRQRADLANAEKHYQEAMEESQKLGHENLVLADILDQLGFPAYRHGDLAKAEEYYSNALAIQQRLAPDSLNLSKSLNGLGLVNLARGDLTSSEEYFRQTLAIRERLVPGSLDVAGTLNNLGLVASNRGDLAEAEKNYRNALAIKEKFAPESLDVASTLHNLGILSQNRGDLTKAEECYRKAIAIKEKLAPASLDLAASLNSLGVVVWDRHDLAKAEEYYRQALVIQEKLAPDGADIAITLNNLGLFARARGDLAKAEEYQNKALAIREQIGPDSLEVAMSFNNLGNLAYERGDLVKAEKYHRRELAIKEKLAPNSITEAICLINLGDAVRDRGDLAKAEEYYQQARTIDRKLAPESKEYAEVLADLAGIMLRKGQLDAAAPLFDQALNALESQTSHLGGSEDVRSNFRAKYLSYYQDYIDLLIRQRRHELAFEVLERSRARTLLEMLNEAHIDVRKGVDAALLEQQRSVAADLSAKYDRRIHLLSGQHTDQQIGTINQEIEKLLAQHKDVEEQILASSPGYAALTQPRPLGAKQAQQLLDNDTLLLEYSLGREHSYVFALTSDSLEVFPLPKGAKIEATALRAYHEMNVNNPAGGYKSTTALSGALLGPVRERMGKKRLVIVADGMLQYVPFGALRTSQGAPLLAEHEIAYLPSASTLAVLRKQIEERPPAPRQLAVLADPVFDAGDPRLKTATAGDLKKDDSRKKALPQNQDDPIAVTADDSTAADLLTRSAADLGMTAKGVVYLPRLPSTRQEAENILALAKTGQSMKALDFDASRSTATSPALADYGIVHFATHGLLNSTHPELSGLVFSLVDKDGKQQNGFLSLQDIYNLNLSADLVVLSACETGLGRQIQGEGLVGLTRAFMYAGAPRVVASLWRVPDRATAELMKRFYTAMLVDRLPPAAALRQAQISLSKEKRWSAPYYWAGFTLQGEWK